MTVAPSGGAPPRLFLVDGYALIYRAFFAMITRPLRTAKGENTSAAWGVANFLLRLRETHRPDYVAWIHDAGDSFRTSRYPEYKSTREKLDDELQADFDTAVERVTELLAAWRVPLIAVEGYEADDVIGTLAVQAAARDVQVVIVSGDKDFYQLIGPSVALLNPGRGGPGAVEEIYVDESNAADRLGVPPRQVADYLALVGDSSDNVPGVKGIGDKGARKLLEEYGDLDDHPGARGRRPGQADPRGAARAGGPGPALPRTGDHPEGRAGRLRPGAPGAAGAGSRGARARARGARVLRAGAEAGHRRGSRAARAARRPSMARPTAAAAPRPAESADSTLRVDGRG